MKHGPAFQFYASDYLSSSKVQRMSLEEEGAYIRLLCYNWQDGWIPDDIQKLARMCKTSPRRMAAIWESLKECFGPLPDFPDRLVNPRLEHTRQTQVEFRSRKQRAGHDGGVASGASRNEAKRSSASIMLEANGKQNEPLQSSVSSLQSPTGEKKLKREPAATAARPPDEAFEIFRIIHDETRAPAKYGSEDTAGFVQLAKLRKAHGIGTRASPPGWEQACRNYFASNLAKYSLADLCVRYSVFVHSPLNQFNKQERHSHGSHLASAAGVGTGSETPGSTSERRTANGKPLYIPKQ